MRYLILLLIPSIQLLSTYNKVSVVLPTHTNQVSFGYGRAWNVRDEFVPGHRSHWQQSQGPKPSTDYETLVVTIGKYTVLCILLTKPGGLAGLRRINLGLKILIPPYL